jgi:hypothetical protein
MLVKEPMMEFHVLSVKMRGWDMAMLREAADNYILENMDMMDCSALLDLVNQIDDKLEIDN